MKEKLHAAKAHSVFKYPLFLTLPQTRPRLQASEKLHSPIGLFKIHFQTTLRWLQNQTYSNETVMHATKAEDTQLRCLDFLRFTCCFLLFVAQLAPSLPFTARRLLHHRPTPGLPSPAVRDRLARQRPETDRRDRDPR